MSTLWPFPTTLFMNALRFLLCAQFAIALAACENAPDAWHFSGYVEGEFVLVGADESGRLDSLAVKEGDSIDKGAFLFALETSREDAALAAAKARLEQAEAALNLSKVGLERAQELIKQGVVPRSRLDDAQSSFDANNAATAAARANVEDARTRLARRRIASPVTGLVQQIYFRPGEIVAAGRPVVALLPPGNLKIRFFVPEPARPIIKIGETVQVNCDGCRAGLTAKISFVSTETEYAPPVIFSREERSKLLFMIEARPDQAAAGQLPLGQPVTVSLDHASQAIGP